MAYNADALLERAKLKSKLRRWRFIAIVVVTLLLVTVAGRGVQGRGGAPLSQDYIARIEFSGFINVDNEVLESLDSIAENKHIKAVLVSIDSPGGTAVGGEVYYDALKMLQQKKPVIALFNNIATSAAYFIATPTERIYARKATLTGSIGALVQFPNFQGLSEKVGVKMQTVKTGDLKGEPTPFTDISPEAEAMLQGLVDDFQRVFVSTISEHRKMGIGEVQAMADGRVFTGQQAIAHRLVDAIGGEKEAIGWLEEQKKIVAGLKVYEVKLKQPKSELEKLLMGATIGKLLAPEAFSFNGLLSIWQKGVIFQ